MATLDYNEIKERKIIIWEGEPYEVTESHVARTQQRKPQNQVKMKNLISGRTVNTTFHASDRAEEAEISKQTIKFLYQNRGEFWFCDPEDPKNRFALAETIIGGQTKFLKENLEVEAVVFTDQNDEERIIGIKLPIKMEFEVVEAPPNVKGDSATGGNKLVKIETGAMINTPLFIEVGEIIRVNTETGEYTERVSK